MKQTDNCRSTLSGTKFIVKKMRDRIFHSSNTTFKNTNSRTPIVPSESALPADTSSPSGISSETYSPKSGNRKRFEMDRVNLHATKTTTHSDSGSRAQNSKVHKDHRHLCERREKLNQTKPHPILHPDVADAQIEENSVIRFSEDSRPMFSPIPRNSSSDAEGEDSPRAVTNKSGRDKIAFPSIHVDKCEKSQPSYAASFSPEPVRRSPDSDMDIDSEVMSTSQGSGGLNVPSPYLHRKPDGRLVLLTQDSNRGMLSSWSRSEGNLPAAVRRSSSSPGSHSHLLDIKYRPDWQIRPTLRQSSDIALHELRREGQGSPASPRRLTARLEPLSLNKDHRALSSGSLQSP